MKTNSASATGKLRLILLIVLVSLLIAASIFCGILLVRRAHYNGGLHALEAGDYPLAQQEFQAAGNYADAPQMALSAQHMEHYRLGKLAFEAGDYYSAVDEFTSASDYSDAPDWLATSQKGIHYCLGDEAITREDYAAALDEFIAADDFSDAAQKKSYCEAMLLMIQGDYVGARDMLTDLKDLPGAEQHWLECHYYMGVAAMEKGDYILACELFTTSGDALDSKALLASCAYSQGKLFLSQNDLSNAKTYFITARDHGGPEDAASYAQLCEAELTLSNESLKQGIALYDALPDSFLPEEFDIAARRNQFKPLSSILTYEGNWSSSSYNITVSTVMDGWVYTSHYKEGVLKDQYASITLLLNSNGTVTVKGTVHFYYFSSYPWVSSLYSNATKTLNFTIENVTYMPYTFTIDKETRVHFTGKAIRVTYQGSTGSASASSDVTFALES